MEDRTWQLLINDIKDIKKDLKELRNDVSALKVKVATISALFGVIGAYAQKYIHKIL